MLIRIWDIYFSTQPGNNKGAIVRIPLASEISDAFFDKLEMQIYKTKHSKDRLCSLIFDNVGIDEYILFDKMKNEVKEYVDYKNKCMPQLADHVTI